MHFYRSFVLNNSNIIVYYVLWYLLCVAFEFIEIKPFPCEFKSYPSFFIVCNFWQYKLVWHWLIVECNSFAAMKTDTCTCTCMRSHTFYKHTHMHATHEHTHTHIHMHRQTGRHTQHHYNTIDRVWVWHGGEEGERTFVEYSQEYIRDTYLLCTLGTAQAGFINIWGVFVQIFLW